MSKKTVRKILTIEVETTLTNAQLRKLDQMVFKDTEDYHYLYRDLDAHGKIVQVQVNAVDKKAKP